MVMAHIQLGEATCGVPLERDDSPVTTHLPTLTAVPTACGCPAPPTGNQTPAAGGKEGLTAPEHLQSPPRCSCKLQSLSKHTLQAGQARSAGRKHFAVTWNGSCLLASARAHPCHIMREPEDTGEHREGCSAIPDVSCGGPAVPTGRKLEQAAARGTEGTMCPYAHCPGAGCCGTVLSSRDRFKKCPSGGRRVLAWPKVALRHPGPMQAPPCPARLVCDRCNVPPSILLLAHANDCQHGTEAMKGKKITP